CDLQNFAFEHGLQKTRSEFHRREFEPVDIGPHIKLHMTRCILCYRCTMVADQLTEERVHGILWRGEASEISTYIQKAIENDFSGNMIDVCPVGALTDRHFRFRNRVWYLNPMSAHRNCPHCTGKVVLWMRGDEVYRVTGRKDEYGEVREFICNECRWDRYEKTDWVIEGPREFEKWSVITANKYDDDTVELPDDLYSKLDNEKWNEFEGVT
ncbi:MAG: Fe-S-binding domain-containing protein, partial [Chitinophagales bacterium]